MANKNQQNKPSVDEPTAPQEDASNFVTQTSRHPSGNLITGEEKPTGESIGENENVSK